MPVTGRHPRRAAAPLSAVLLFGLVVVGHVLFGHAAAVSGTALRATAAPAAVTGPAGSAVPGTAVRSTTPTAPQVDDRPGGHCPGHRQMFSGCTMLLVVGLSAGALALLRVITTTPRPPAMSALLLLRGRRGPPRSTGRLALCVSRV
ncbi:hypothetical protein GIS00_02820 [Nakamurella sp. YIM 132087]|uniref:Uncharacterized protein n=1 Tax=Nakamurella alba TaxID=2665158 RepID=A0A7K1FFJ3_9ACTN|nr:hypothetical protein [Nakamurella alba]MTD12878.1 hypothetical protein [Nakamurella alba]